MIRIHSIYNRMLCGILLLSVTCGMGMSCTDDYFSEKGGNSVRMTTLNVRLPKADTGSDSEVGSARFIAFEAGGAGISGALQINTNIALTGAHIQIPVGKSNIFIVANAPESLKLDEITSENELKEKIATWEAIKKLPHVMLGSYINVSVREGGVKDNAGNAITVGNNLKRIVSKLTVNLQYQSLGGDELMIDDITVGNRASYSFLLPAAFAGDDYVSSDVDKVTNLTATGTIDGITSYQPIEFYLSEYLVNEVHKSKSTCLYIHAHIEGKEDEPLTFPVYIGDWFGKGTTYEDFKNADTPAALVGIEGLSVTRNKHYTLTCKLKGAELIETDFVTNVKDWEIVNINGNINAPFLDLDKTDVQVNPISEATPVHYSSSVKKENIQVDIIENPNDIFRASVSSDDVIKFYLPADELNTKRLVDDSGNMLRGKAVVIATDGNVTIKKQINLGIFNSVSKFFIRSNYENFDYGSVTPATNLSSIAKHSWNVGMGFSNPYNGVTSSLKGKNPMTTFMGNAIPDKYIGCAGYWEGAKNDRQTGRGCWRAPYASETKRLLNLIINRNKPFGDGYDNVPVSSDFYIWSSTESSGEYAYRGNINDENQGQPYRKILYAGYTRCVRDIDNSIIGGGSSYLLVSHNKYEIAPLTFRTMPGIVPIYYESDGPVSISLIDENGNDISNMGEGMPFIGFSAPNERDLYKVLNNAETDSSGEPPIVFPNMSYTNMNKGYFCLHSTVRCIPEYYTSLGDMKGPMPSETRKKKYSLLFKSGDISKSIPILIVNPLAAASHLGKTMSLLEAMGITTTSLDGSINDYYVGYDYLQDKIIQSAGVQNILFNVPLPNNPELGCAAYYEGTATDPKTGKGNWFVSPSVIAIGTAYAKNADRWGISKNNIKALNNMYGEGANFPQIGDNGFYWWTTKGDPGDKSRHYNVKIPSGAIESTYKYSVDYARCERRLNADILSLSDISVKLSPGESFEVLYYTDVLGVGTELLDYSQKGIAFTTTTTTTTGRIQIVCNNDAKSGSVNYLLVHTEGGASLHSKTYKMIKLQVK